MDDALNARMKELADHILFAREWKALELIREELISLHGLIADSNKGDT